VFLTVAGELDRADIAQTIAPWIQLVFGCIAIPSAILFMRQNRISRKILLTLSWLLTVGIIGVGVGWLIVFSQNSPEPVIALWMLSGFILVMLFYGVPTYFMLKALHSRLLRDAFEQNGK
jgi:heme A synthase